MSCLVHRLNDNYWSCYFLVDEYFDELSRCDLNDGLEGAASDPIINEPRPGRVSLPLPYGLLALSNNMKVVLKHHDDFLAYMESGLTEWVGCGIH